MCGRVLSGCGCVAVSCVVVVPCLSFVWLSCMVIVLWLFPAWLCIQVELSFCDFWAMLCFTLIFCGLLGGCQVELAMGVTCVSTEPPCGLPCVCLCAPSTPPPVEGYATDVGPSRDGHAHRDPHSPSASSSAQWLGLRFSRLLGKMLKGPAGPM